MILTLTLNAALDVVTSVPHVKPSGKLRCSPPRHAPGGGGVNVSRTIAALGGTSTAVFASGGLNGRRIEEELEAIDGLDARPVAIEGETRENLLVRETATGQELHFVMPGPQLSAVEWQALLDAVAGAEPAPDYVVASGSLPLGVPADFYARLAGIVRARSGRLILDTRAGPLRQALDEGVWLIKPNVGELAELAGQELGEESALEAAARDLVGEGSCDVVLLSLGRGGAIVITRDEPAVHLRSPVVRQASRVGAGDAMVGGTVLALERGLPLADAVRAGVVTGAATVVRPAFEPCRPEDVEALSERIGAAAGSPR